MSEPENFVQRALGEKANEALRSLQEEMLLSAWPDNLRVAMWKTVAMRATTFAECAERRVGVSQP